MIYGEIMDCPFCGKRPVVRSDHGFVIYCECREGVRVSTDKCDEFAKAGKLWNEWVAEKVQVDAD